MLPCHFLLLSLFLMSVVARKHHHSESTEEDEKDKPSEVETRGKEIIDRMMVNMAGAMVKSIFPEMDKFDKTDASQVSRLPVDSNALPPGAAAHDVRRAPYPQSYGVASQDGYGQSGAGGMSQLGGGQLGQLGPIVGALASSGALDTLTGSSASNSPGTDPRLINEMRNQAYLAELAKHQHELTEYSAKQMEYLDQQRRYQQAVIDHQAEAALLMQKEQQKNINEAMGQAKTMYAKQRAFLAARARGSRTHVPDERSSKPGDAELTSDSELRTYFKRQYGIDIPEDGAALTDDERETLRLLKEELVSKKGSGRGTANTFGSSRKGSGVCNQCQAISIRKLSGSWTQVYGNPDVIRQTFGTIQSLQRMSRMGRKGATAVTGRKPACVGLEVGSYQNGEAEANFFFRDDDDGSQLHEMKGELSKTGEGGLSLETDMYSAEFCVVKTGPADEDRPEYIVLAEKQGTNACRSLHVFARNTDEFNRRHFDDVSEFMKKHVSKRQILPVGAFPKAELCELLRP